MGCVTLCACAGAATGDIIEQYVSTIKTLREVDPTGAISCHFCSQVCAEKIFPAYYCPECVLLTAAPQNPGCTLLPDAACHQLRTRHIDMSLVGSKDCL